MLLTNRQLIEVLDKVQAYTDLQQQLSNKLSKGRLAFVTSKKYQGT
jgi:hypothetical protein